MRLFVWLALLLVAVPCFAHDPGLSSIRIIHRDRDTVISISTTAKEIGNVISTASAAQWVRQHLKLRIDGAEFTPPTGASVVDPASDIVIWQTVLLRKVSTVGVLSRLVERPEARTLVSFTKGGQVTSEALLDADHPSYIPYRPASPSDEGLRHVTHGITHILSGPDHILFVLALLLLGGTFRSILKTVTAFTVAHSITLTLAATGLFNPPSAVVEPLIALSIVAVAIENLTGESRDGKRDARPAIAFVFGLIHGFGFAGALSGLGLQRWDLGTSLVLFNVGVELGQACIIVAAFPLITWASQRPALRWPRISRLASVAIGITGAVWFIQRLFSPG